MYHFELINMKRKEIYNWILLFSGNVTELLMMNQIKSCI